MWSATMAGWLIAQHCRTPRVNCDDDDDDDDDDDGGDDDDDDDDDDDVVVVVCHDGWLADCATLSYTVREL